MQPFVLLALALFLQDAEPTPIAPPQHRTITLDAPQRDALALREHRIHTPTLDTQYVRAPTVGHRYVFEATRSGTHTVEMTSYLFDTYLVVRDAEGAILAENDDGPVSTHSVLKFKARKSARYFIDAAALHGHRGPYELEIRRGRPKFLLPAARMNAMIEDARQRVRAYEIEYGEHHPATGIAICNLGAVHFQLKQFAPAREHFEASVRFHEHFFGPRHAQTAVNLDNLALALTGLADYEAAAPLHRRSLTVFEQTRGPQHHDTLVAMQNLALCLSNSGRLSEARDILESIIATYGEQNSLSSSSSLRAHAKLVQVFHAQDNPIAARQIIERAMRICHETSGPEHPAFNTLRFASITNKTAQNQLTAALQECEQLVEDLRRKSDPRLGIALSNLAVCRGKLGDHRKAHEALREAVAIQETTLGQRHPVTLRTRHNLAAQLRVAGQSEESLEICRLIVKDSLDSLGPEHPRTLDSMTTLAYLLAEAAIESDFAIDLLEQALRTRLSILDREMPSMHENERLLMVSNQRGDIGTYVRLALSQRDINIDALYAHVIRWKGMVSRGALQDRQWIRSRTKPEVERFLEERTANSAAASALLRSSESDTLRERIEAIRRSTRSPVVAVPPGNEQPSGPGSLPTPEGIREQLGSREVLLDFVAYPNWEEVFLACFVSTASGPTELIDFGSLASLQRKIDFFLDATRDRDPATLELTSTALFDAMWPLIAHRLEGMTNIIVCPDGPTASIPFGAIRSPDGSYLVEKYDFRYLQDIAVLSSPESESARGDTILLAGGIDYDASGDTLAIADPSREMNAGWRGYAPDAIRTGQDRFEYLGASKSEVEAIASLHSRHFPVASAVLLVDGAATEVAIREAVATARYVHLATHGYSAPDATGPDFELVRGANSLPTSTLDLMLPGLRCGIVAAGANQDRSALPLNQAIPGYDDGFLTAEEMSWMDLSNCDLVVLSACDTGRGSSIPGEHQLGLRRSLRLAGARSTLTSLWRVDDGSTKDLMIDFYRNLWEKKMSKHEALRAAQLKMLRENEERYGWGDASTWGAFILEGEWR